MGPVQGHQCPYDSPSVAEHFRKTGTVNLNPADVLLFRDSLKHLRCIVYEYTPRGTQTLEENLKNTVRNLLARSG